MALVLARYDGDPQTPCTTFHAQAQRYVGPGGLFDTIGGAPSLKDIKTFSTSGMPSAGTITSFLAAGGR